MESILDVHSKYSELIKDVFKADQSFVGALDKACSAVVNYRPVPRQPARAPELVNLLRIIIISNTCRFSPFFFFIYLYTHDIIAATSLNIRGNVP